MDLSQTTKQKVSVVFSNFNFKENKSGIYKVMSKETVPNTFFKQQRKGYLHNNLSL